MILGIYCAGGNGKTLVDLANVINQEKHCWDRIIFVDDVTDEKEIYGIEVYKFQDAVEKFNQDELEFSISIGEPHHRKTLYEKVKSHGYQLPVLIHPNAFLPKDLIVGEGTIIVDVSIGSTTKIGVNTAISQNAIVGHDTIVGNHCCISAGSFIAGHCTIGDEVYVGPMAAIRDRINVESTAVIAMSAAIYKDVSSDSIAIGNPARCMKKGDNYRIF